MTSPLNVQVQEQQLKQDLRALMQRHGINHLKLFAQAEGEDEIQQVSVVLGMQGGFENATMADTAFLAFLRDNYAEGLEGLDELISVLGMQLMVDGTFDKFKKGQA